jgi:succinate dehydrogenase/fumarate reductase flavoprotein subunit
VISPKNGYKLKKWLAWAERFQEELENQVVIRNGHELSKLYEVENIIQCASLSAGASLARKESRWGQGHRRTDYPEIDNENWLCHVVVKRGADMKDIQVMKKPLIDLEGQEVTT